MRKTVTISPNRKISLNRISDYLINEHHDLIEALEGFDLITGKSSFLGAGDPPVESIVLTVVFKNPGEDQQEDLDKIIALGKEKADELKIEITVKQQ